MTFIPVKPARNKGARKLELAGSFTFPASPLPWSLTASAKTQRIGPVVVDTDGDLTPDTVLSGTSNFSPGQTPGRFKAIRPSCSCCPEESCHAEDGERHCNFLPMCPGTNSCC